MDAKRFALTAATALLALAACGDGSRSDTKRSAPPAPLGFEMAFAAAAPDYPGEAAAEAVPGAHAEAPLVALTPEELAARLAAGKVRLIDVRTQEEVAEGMIPGAEHIPLGSFDPAALGPSDGREVVLYCRSGRRSAIAGEQLAAATGAPAQHLAGGILAWEAAGQPTERR